MWPFKKQSQYKKSLNQNTTTDVKKKNSVTLTASDDDITWAVNMLSLSGICVNDTVYNQIVPWMARVVSAYQELDRQTYMKENNE
jgi:hypothetical protein